MSIKKIGGKDFYYMIISGCNNLEEQKNYVNSLNVFPVPDGDTGTNMSMTFRSATEEILSLKDETIGEVSKKLSRGALMGARGNSGVILSQIFRGIAKGLEGKSEVTSSDLANAIEEGAKSAYKAVMRPTEGTILTVIRSAGEHALNYKGDDVIELLEEVIKGSEDTLNKTPDMLPALKAAKVVDAGGMGLLVIFKGMLKELKEGNKPSLDGVGETVEVSSKAELNGEAEITYGYCTEFFINTTSITSEEFKKEIENMGDSLISVGSDGLIKIHIHTEQPGEVLTKALAHGSLSKIKIDNMREQHRKVLEAEYETGTTIDNSSNEEKEYGFVAVAMGSGIKKIFENDLNVDVVIEGGQTMNPSTQDFIDAVGKINAKNIVILPNNKNVVMAANQAKDVCEKNVIVIPTRTIPQGIAAITVFNGDASVEDNEANMNEAVSNVKSASVTFAVRDTEIEGKEIKEGDILGLIEGKVKVVGHSINEVVKELLENLVDDESSLISLYSGEDVKEEENSLYKELENIYDDIDVLTYKGEQPLYYYLISVE